MDIFELVRRWRLAAEKHLSPTKQSLLVTWSAFGTTFAITRVITHGIRGGWLPWGNVSVGTKHLHHYNFGIGVLSGVGLVAVRGDERAIRHPLVAGAYGAGAALIVDEFALLLDLEDVYWAKEGRKSVDAAFGVLAALGTYLTAVPFWHEVVKVAHQHVKHYRRAWVGGRSENRVAE
ncbi:hypothetical protein [Kitasatospora sp. GAS204B]|uniref:hypothetical protein n=1 Tax=unclassified Kitasatospora TaxID=2633591 RepID=UPI002474EF8B|nr:hypothetical protein [Kitasatospora sp. GAS204B]